MSLPGRLSILTHFKGLKDPRIKRRRKHLLLDIIVLTICAVVADAEGWEDIEAYGRAKFEFLKGFLALPNGIPSHDTIERLFQRLKPAEFERCFRSWTRALAEELGLKHVAIDGKTLRRSFDNAAGKSALHLVSAWSVENHLTLGQQAVDGKSNEITAIPQLLHLLELNGAVVTIDAMGCQKEIADRIVEAGGEYILAVKENQPNLHQDILDHFIHIHESEDAKCRHYRTTEKGHGRVEERDYYITPVPDTLRNREGWRGLKSIGQVVRQVERDGKVTGELCLYISSLETNAKQQGWVPVGDGPEDCWHRAAMDNFAADVSVPMDGFYELCGPKVQSNQESYGQHVLVGFWVGGQSVAQEIDAPRDFDGIKAFLTTHDIEGVVWHHPDGRMVKIKAKDFGIKRGV